MTEDNRKNPQKTRLIALVIASSALLAACGGTVVDTTEPPTFSVSSEGPSTNSKINLELPDMTITAYQRADLLGGEEVHLSELVSQGKPVVLNFWAALCPPCRAEMPDIQRVFDQRGGEVTIVGIDIGPQQFLGSREDAKRLLVDLGISYPVGTTFDESIVRDFRLVGMPTTFFIHADGSLLQTWSGLLTEAKINEFIDEMLSS